MDGDKVLNVIKTYRDFFELAGIPKGNFSHDRKIEFYNRRVDVRTEVLAHCHGMLDEMEEFVRQGRMMKAFRWLGFIQGCLWSVGDYTLDELKDHNRPKNAD